MSSEVITAEIMVNNVLLKVAGTSSGCKVEITDNRDPRDYKSHESVMTGKQAHELIVLFLERPTSNVDRLFNLSGGFSWQKTAPSTIGEMIKDQLKNK